MQDIKLSENLGDCLSDEKSKHKIFTREAHK